MKVVRSSYNAKAAEPDQTTPTNCELREEECRTSIFVYMTLTQEVYCSPFGVGMNSPSQHWKPTSVEIYVATFSMCAHVTE